MKINYDDLDEMYEAIPMYQSIRPSDSPVGSLTDNRRKVLPNLNGAVNREAKTRYRSLRKLKWNNAFTLGKRK